MTKEEMAMKGLELIGALSLRGVSMDGIKEGKALWDACIEALQPNPEVTVESPNR